MLLKKKEDIIARKISVHSQFCTWYLLREMLQQHVLQWQCTTQIHWYVCLTPLSALWTTDMAEIECLTQESMCATPHLEGSLYICALPASPALKKMRLKELTWIILVHHHTASHHLKAKSSSKIILESQLLGCARSGKMSRKGQFLRVGLPESLPAETKLIKIHKDVSSHALIN